MPPNYEKLERIKRSYFKSLDREAKGLKRKPSKNERRKRRALEESEAKRLREMPYREYLKTPHWEKKRRAKLRSVGSRCERCGRGNCEVHVHHKHYKTVGRERLSDLEVLCKGCHSHEHDGLIAAASHMRSISGLFQKEGK